MANKPQVIYKLSEEDLYLLNRFIKEESAAKLTKHIGITALTLRKAMNIGCTRKTRDKIKNYIKRSLYNRWRD